MALTLPEVHRIARLARLTISETEANHTLEQLNAVFGMIEQLQAVDTKGVAPMTHAEDIALRLRDDVVTEVQRRDDYQALAPATENGLYLVPRVIE